MDGTDRSRIDVFTPGFALATIGLGLFAMAAVEATRLDLESAGMHASTATSPPGAAGVASGRTERTHPEPALGAFAGAPAWLALPQDSVAAVGGGGSAPEGGGAALVGLAASPMPNGLAIFRLYSNGAVEAMITTEENRWGPWVPVAPGRSTDMRRPPAESGSGNPDTENP